MTITVKQRKVFLMKIYTVTKTAEKLGISRQSLHQWIKKGWVKPKYDYRNYPVFTADDIKKIQQWMGTLKESCE